MKIRFHQSLFYVITALFYIYYVLSNRRDYQDSWILQDIFVSTSIFVLVFAVTVILSNDNRITVLICSSFVIIMNLVPAMKYESFYGIADVTFHYRFVNEIMNSGYVPGNTDYSGTPGMQIFISLFSLFLGISSNLGFKYTIPISFGVFPFIIYFISNKLIKNNKLQKYIIISSGFPIVTAYYLLGTIFPLLMLIFIGPLLIIEILYKESKIEYKLILIIILFTILISHTVTSLLFLILSIISLILLTLYDKFHKIRQIDFRMLRKGFCILLLFSAILYIFWWMYESEFLFSIFVKSSMKTVQHFFVNTDFRKEPVPQRFFEISFISKIQILSIYHLKDIIIMIFSLSGIFIFFKKKIKLNKLNIIFYLYVISFLIAILIILGFEFLIKYGDLEYYRFIDYGIIFSPFFVGLSLYRLSGKLNSTIIEILIIFIVIISALIQFFPYQPFVPKASIINSKINDEEPLMYFHHVNTVYQKDMISFASSYSSNKTIIASDIVTRLQLISFFNQSFNNIGSKNSTLLWFSPLTTEKLKWNLFLLHWNGKSGPFTERAEYRSDANISQRRNNKNVIYDNGEAFIIKNQEQSI